MKGQTLIEVLVALGVAVVVMTAISSAVITGLNNAQYSKLQNQATQYAQQGMEQMQNYRDAKSLRGFTGATTYKCLNAGCNPVTDTSCFTPPPASGVCSLIEGNFSRKVIMTRGVTNCGVGNVQVNVKVEWSDGKCTGTTPCHRVDVSSCMLDSLRPSLGP